MPAALDFPHVHLHLHLPAGVAAYAPGTGVACAAAVMFALGSVLQHEAASRSVSGERLDVRRLVRERVWLLGQGATVAGTLLQVVALGLVPVAIVQPVIAGGLVVALAMRTVRERCLPTGLELGGAVLTTGGLAVFLVAARPATGAPQHTPGLFASLVAVAAAGCVVALATRVRRGPLGALACGIGAGFAAGTAAVLISAALKILERDGAAATLVHAPLWAAIAVAVIAQVGSQQAYSRGALAWSLPALTVVDPLAAVPAARFLLGERLEPGHAAVWLPAAMVAALGVVLLARSGDDVCRRPIGRRRRERSSTGGDDAGTGCHPNG